MIMRLISQRKWLFLLLLFSVVFWLIFCTYNTKENISWWWFYKQKPIYKRNSSFTLTPYLKCEGDDHFLVILVATRPNEIEARQAIRVTWGQERMWLSKKVLTLFLIGKDAEHQSHGKQSVEEEFAQYGDIISQNFIESYNNLTLKTMMAFQWISEFCPKAEYVMKVDSDVFINVKYLVTYLLKINKNVSSDFFTGYPFINTKPHRGFVKKAYISKTDYPFSIYPPYCSGLGYVFSGELGLKIYNMMSHVKPIRFEDVYVGICLKILGVNLHIPEEGLFFLKQVKFDKCLFSRLIAVHDVTPQQLNSYWEDLQGLEISTC
ncbi:UDP-GalNAc:beta-1,3-N-acetylgalactosaminyltransferase 1-like [Pristis pectinata]|uniref:UDP-GalNAc:beta-1, 3-N-acetylgalactosaminyltransferase 1-like n=1 Tax=Pristis pectinata TaxID=685728 RepID=UPI00223D830B|nr:UDP-GalNAc:beta-1,3-N-acetylgalactosaminyltransferase 1-like [Pristis pectinata]XP_051873204.1 UDP-GalNAc:beta-1,3-N-acetylgalactosaminyltransferase 1-like [Pristis pectinata]XP_051873205.1 UDP-GalNAc:beta-1,3-N-acetylgalactosaminyltransferase 1-like [Pristis pectinata]